MTASISPEIEASLRTVCLQDTNALLGVDGSTLPVVFDVDRLFERGAPLTVEERGLAIDGLIGAIQTAIETVAEVHPVDAVGYHRRRGGVGSTNLLLPTRVGESSTRQRFFIDPKRHLTGQLSPDHQIPRDAKVAIVTDVTATGQEVIEAANVLWRRGLKGVRAISVFDTNEGAREWLAQYDIPLTTIMSLAEAATRV